MDIEGAEVDALKGMKYTFSNSRKVKCLVCAYHQEFAYECIVNFFKSNDFNLEHTSGYMYYPEGLSMMKPKFRRGLVRAYKGDDANEKY